MAIKTIEFDPALTGRFKISYEEDSSLLARLKALLGDTRTVYVPDGTAGGLIYDVGPMQLRSNQINFQLVDNEIGKTYSEDQLKD